MKTITIRAYKKCQDEAVDVAYLAEDGRLHFCRRGELAFTPLVKVRFPRPNLCWGTDEEIEAEMIEAFERLR